MSGRVGIHHEERGEGPPAALEVVLREPDLFRGVVMLAPPLPRREHRWALAFARLLSAEIAKRLPVEWAWPWLEGLADRLETEAATTALRPLDRRAAGERRNACRKKFANH